MASRGGSREHGGGRPDSGRKLSVEYNLEKAPMTDGRPPCRFQWASFFRLRLGADYFSRRSAAFLLVVLITVIAIFGVALLSGGLGVFRRYTDSIR